MIYLPLLTNNKQFTLLFNSLCSLRMSQSALMLSSIYLACAIETETLFYSCVTVDKTLYCYLKTLATFDETKPKTFRSRENNSTKTFAWICEFCFTLWDEREQILNWELKFWILKMSLKDLIVKTLYHYLNCLQVGSRLCMKLWAWDLLNLIQGPQHL